MKIGISEDSNHSYDTCDFFQHVFKKNKMLFWGHIKNKMRKTEINVHAYINSALDIKNYKVGFMRNICGM
jgi:hypothetical protein